MRRTRHLENHSFDDKLKTNTNQTRRLHERKAKKKHTCHTLVLPSRIGLQKKLPGKKHHFAYDSHMQNLGNFANKVEVEEAKGDEE